MRKQEWLLLIGLFLVVSILETVVVHDLFTARFTGGNDFYSRWAGARALLVEGRDPYSPEVTAEIQAVKGLDPELEGKGSFAYPLHVIFLFLPLVYLPYPWALAIWMVLLQWVTVAAAALLFRLLNWRLSLAGATLMVFGTLFLYPVARSVLLGQFTLHVLLFLGGALWALRHRKDGWAGILLAGTSVKPQMMLLIGPWLVLWTIGQRRWRFLWGLLGGGAVMFVASLALFPRWPISFVEDVQRYAKVAGGRNPMAVFFDQLWPGAGETIRLVLMGILLAAMLVAWWRARNKEWRPFLQATHWTIVVSLLVYFQTGTTNQVLLLLPLFDWLARVSTRPGGKWTSAAIIAALLLFPWLLFIQTVSGNAESPLMFWPLPLLALAVLIAQAVYHWRASRGVPLRDTG